MSPSFGEQLIIAAADRYRPAGAWAWRLAANKLRMDPVYLQVLRSGALPDQGTVLDLGCGRGLMFALISAARDRYRAGDWPSDWPAPPRGSTLVGIERRGHVAALARLALGPAATIRESDVATTSIPRCSAILAFDLLHLLTDNVQNRLLERSAVALETDGVLFLREADASAPAFPFVRAGNRIVALLQGHPRRSFHYRSRRDWAAALCAHGFVAEAVGGVRAAGRVNLLFQARRARPDSFGATAV